MAQPQKRSALSRCSHSVARAQGARRRRTRSLLRPSRALPPRRRHRHRSWDPLSPRPGDPSRAPPNPAADDTFRAHLRVSPHHLRRLHLRRRGRHPRAQDALLRLSRCDPLTYREVLRLWRADRAFRDVFLRALADETPRRVLLRDPPVTRDTLDRPYEHVITDAPCARRPAAEPHPFREHLERARARRTRRRLPQPRRRRDARGASRRRLRVPLGGGLRAPRRLRPRCRR